MRDLTTVTLGSSTDPYRSADALDWDITDGSALQNSLTLTADVVIVGTGAGGGTAAEVLSQAGLSVVVLEEGPLKTSSQFDMQEPAAYRDLYQEGSARGTKDGAIGILQGRAVGGSTTVNWTSSFRTPPETLRFWAEHMGVSGCSAEEMAPFFEHMEQRLGVHPWQLPPNENNAMLKRAAEKLGYSWATIPRNVKGCLDLGYCGMGCPVDAKQSMLVTTVPGALRAGAKLVHHVRAQRVLLEGDGAVGIEAVALAPNVRGVTGHTVTVRADHTVLCGGAINTPAILLRSDAPDPHDRLGKRTFLHPTTLSLAVHDEAIDPYYGAPQSIYSDHFQWKDGATGPCSFKLEVPPLHPIFTASFATVFGRELTDTMAQLPKLQCMIALMRDGFDDASPGGTVGIDGDGHPLLDYPVGDHLLDGVRRGWKVMAEMQFAAGAKSVRPAHVAARHYTSWKEAEAAIDDLTMAPHKATIGSAHVMGGCAMGDDATHSVTDCDGKHHQLDGLYVMDGSLFPTSIGANPQLSIYGLVYKLASGLAARVEA